MCLQRLPLNGTLLTSFGVLSDNATGFVSANITLCAMQVEQIFGAKPLTSLTPHLLNQYRECLEACMEEADLEDYFSRGIGVSVVADRWCKHRFV